MPAPLVIAVVAGLGGMLGWGLADFFAKKTIDQIGDLPTLVWAHTSGGVVALVGLLVYLVVHRFSGLPHDPITWLGLILFGVLQGLVYMLLYRAFSKGKVSILNPVFASYAGLAALAVVVLFGETLGVARGLALVVIFASVLALSLDEGSGGLRQVRFGSTPGLPEALLATLLAAGWTVGWDRFVHGHNWVVYAALMYVFMAAAITVLAILPGSAVRRQDRSMWVFLGAIGLAEVVAYASISFGFGRSDHAAIVALISGAFSVPTIILARIFLGERINSFQVAGIVAIITGVVVIAVA